MSPETCIADSNIINKKINKRKLLHLLDCLHDAMSHKTSNSVILFEMCTFHDDVDTVWSKHVDKGKGKAVLLQAWSGPEGYSKLRFPYFMTTAQYGGKVVSFTHRPPLPPRKYSWYSFLLEDESTPGP